MMMSRRSLIVSGLAGLGASALSSAAGAAAQPFFTRTKLPIGLQLYTLGADAAADLDGTLRAVAKTGYRTIELAGYVGRTPVQLRKALDDAGLTAPSAHIQPKSRGAEPALDDLPRLIDDCHTIGIKSLFLPSFIMPDALVQKVRAENGTGNMMGRVGTRMTADDWKANADFLNEKGAVLKKAGLRFGYHNHNPEFSPLPAGSGFAHGMDVLLKRTDPALVEFEMDAGWVASAGFDPVAVIKAYPKRFTAMHVKDIKKAPSNFVLEQLPTEVGLGVINWKAILPIAYAAGVRDFYVEQEPPFDRPRLDAVAISYGYLSKLVA